MGIVKEEIAKKPVNDPKPFQCIDITFEPPTNLGEALKQVQAQNQTLQTNKTAMKIMGLEARAISESLVIELKHAEQRCELAKRRVEEAANNYKIQRDNTLMRVRIANQAREALNTMLLAEQDKMSPPDPNAGPGIATPQQQANDLILRITNQVESIEALTLEMEPAVERAAVQGKRKFTLEFEEGAQDYEEPNIDTKRRTLE